jgi:chromosome segregation ATPase
LDYSKKIRNIENYKHGELYDAENALEKEERRIKELEFELQDLRAKVLAKNNFSEGELEKIHTSLRSTQRIAEQQEADLKTLRVERDKARNEARDQEKDMNIAKRRVESLRDENNVLKQQLKRVERLTYGKS